MSWDFARGWSQLSERRWHHLHELVRVLMSSLPKIPLDVGFSQDPTEAQTLTLLSGCARHWPLLAASAEGSGSQPDFAKQGCRGPQVRFSGLSVTRLVWVTPHEKQKFSLKPKVKTPVSSLLTSGQTQTTLGLVATA